MKRLSGLFLVALVALTACEQEGPAERLGENLDQAAQNLDSAARDAVDRLEDAASDVGNAIEDLCEDATNRDC